MSLEVRLWQNSTCLEGSGLLFSRNNESFIFCSSIKWPNELPRSPERTPLEEFVSYRNSSEPTGLGPLLRGSTFAIEKGADVPLYTDFVHRRRILSALEKT